MASYIRRIESKNGHKDQIVQPKVFKCKVANLETKRPADVALSFTLVTNDLNIDEYWHDSKMGTGDLCGLCVVTDEDLSVIEVSIRFDQDLADPKYGHWHYVTDCLDEDTRRRLALLVSEKDRVIRPYRPHD